MSLLENSLPSHRSPSPIKPTLQAQKWLPGFISMHSAFSLQLFLLGSAQFPISLMAEFNSKFNQLSIIIDNKINYYASISRSLADIRINTSHTAASPRRRCGRFYSWSCTCPPTPAGNHWLVSSRHFQQLHKIHLFLHSLLILHWFLK